MSKEEFTGCPQCGAEGCQCYVEVAEEEQRIRRMARVANRMPFPDKDGVIVYPESVDVQIERLSERIEIAEITNRVLREQIESLYRKLEALEEENR